jgi:hypothetical protein
MGWANWVIPLIAVVVWILANLARLPKETPRPPVRKPPLPPREGDQQTSTAPPRSEVERFLAEVNRRRQASVQRRRAPQPEPPPTALPAAPPEAIRRREEARRREDVLARRNAPSAPPSPRRPPTLSPPRSVPVIVAVPEVVPVAPPQPVVEVVALPAPEAALPIVRPTSRTASRVVALLRDPVSLPAAFLLHEIFQPPLSQRAPQGRRRRT